MRIEYRDEIPLPPETIFPWIADPQKAMQWQSDVKSGEILAEVPGTVGTTFREVVERGGRSLEMRGIVTRYDLDTAIGFHIESRIHEFDVVYSLQPVDGATRFTIELTIDWKFPMSLITALVGKRIAERIRKDLASEVAELKRLCAESGHES
jgi:hypothetical protein